MSIRTIRSISRRFLLASLLLSLIVSVANAYTIVMKGGRRVEIPSKFIVTKSTLTYEVQPGIQVTLQLAAIDVSATEKANNENPGAFAGRVLMTTQQTAVPLTPAKAAMKTITNRDLEARAQRRVASEAAYDKKMNELGLPSAAEARRQLEARSTIAQAELSERLGGERQTEEYWRGRAETLRTEMAALDAEIRFVRTKLDEGPNPNWSGGYSSFGNYVPFISFGFGGGGRGRHFPGIRSHGRPMVYSPRGAVGPQFSGRVGYGGRSNRSQVFVNPGHAARGHFGGVRPGRSFGNGSIGVGVGVLGTTAVWGSTAAYDYSYERSELITRFNDLGSARAGLNARWRELEEEARRAGAAPGWLRP